MDEILNKNLEVLLLGAGAFIGLWIGFFIQRDLVKKVPSYNNSKFKKILRKNKKLFIFGSWAIITLGFTIKALDSPFYTIGIPFPTCFILGFILYTPYQIFEQWCKKRKREKKRKKRLYYN